MWQQRAPGSVQQLVGQVQPLMAAHWQLQQTFEQQWQAVSRDRRDGQQQLARTTRVKRSIAATAASQQQLVRREPLPKRLRQESSSSEAASLPSALPADAASLSVRPRRAATRRRELLLTAFELSDFSLRCFSISAPPAAAASSSAACSAELLLLSQTRQLLRSAFPRIGSPDQPSTSYYACLCIAPASPYWRHCRSLLPAACLSSLPASASASASPLVLAAAMFDLTEAAYLRILFFTSPVVGHGFASLLLAHLRLLSAQIHARTVVCATRALRPFWLRCGFSDVSSSCPPGLAFGDTVLLGCSARTEDEEQRDRSARAAHMIATVRQRARCSERQGTAASAAAELGRRPRRSRETPPAAAEQQRAAAAERQRAELWLPPSAPREPLLAYHPYILRHLRTRRLFPIKGPPTDFLHTAPLPPLAPVLCATLQAGYHKAGSDFYSFVLQYGQVLGLADAEPSTGGEQQEEAEAGAAAGRRCWRVRMGESEEELRLRAMRYRRDEDVSRLRVLAVEQRHIYPLPDDWRSRFGVPQLPEGGKVRPARSQRTAVAAAAAGSGEGERETEAAEADGEVDIDGSERAGAGVQQLQFAPEPAGHEDSEDSEDDGEDEAGSELPALDAEVQQPSLSTPQLHGASASRHDSPSPLPLELYSDDVLRPPSPSLPSPSLQRLQQLLPLSPTADGGGEDEETAEAADAYAMLGRGASGEEEQEELGRLRLPVRAMESLERSASRLMSAGSLSKRSALRSAACAAAQLQPAQLTAASALRLCCAAAAVSGSFTRRAQHRSACAGLPCGESLLTNAAAVWTAFCPVAQCIAPL